jgi:hypothetical protein
VPPFRLLTTEGKRNMEGNQRLTIEPSSPEEAGTPATAQRSERAAVEGVTEVAKDSAPQAPSTPKQERTWADMDRELAPLQWGWQGWLANGLLTMVIADSGVGKSALCLHIASSYMLGNNWPDGSPFEGETGSVLWGETEAAQAINLARAKSWNLPLDRILAPLDDPLTDVQLRDPHHQDAIRSHAARVEVRLVIVDSLRGAHSGDENSSEVIWVGKWLAELARDTGKPVLLTHHLRKRSLVDRGEVTLDRMRGSSAIAQTARVVWAIEKPDPTQPEIRRLSMIKNNVAPCQQPLEFAFLEKGLVFTEPSAQAAPDTERLRAMRFLETVLSAGPVPAAEVGEQAHRNGFSTATLNRAKAVLGIKSDKQGNCWVWSLSARGSNILS